MTDSTTLRAEQGSPMTTERALALYGQASSWLRERIGQKCSCGHCHLCAYNHFLSSQSSWAKEKAELKRQLAEADAVIDRYAENVSLLHYPDPQYEHMKQALARHASHPVTAKEYPHGL